MPLGDNQVVLHLTSVKLRATLCKVKIRNFVNRGLKRLYAEDIARGIPPNTADKLRKMLAFLDDMDDPEELRALGPGRCIPSRGIVKAR